MKQDSFKIVCYLGVGEAEFTSFGCDLSYEYVKINASIEPRWGVKSHLFRVILPVKVSKFWLNSRTSGWGLLVTWFSFGQDWIWLKGYLEPRLVVLEGWSLKGFKIPLKNSQLNCPERLVRNRF